MVEGWQNRLFEYIESKRNQPFDWAVNSCMDFVNGASVAMTGFGFVDDLIFKHRNALGAQRFFLVKMAGGTDPLALIDARASRIETPRRGAIIARKSDGQCTGYSLGVVVSRKAAFVGVAGLEFILPQSTDNVWSLW